jgi:L-arabinokinase
MLGSDFLRTHGGISDPLSTVEPEVAYPVRAATLFPLEEHARAVELVALLGRPLTPGAVARLGELLLRSHEGYSSCGLGDGRTDAIVEAVYATPPQHGLLGARVSGGGSGGTVVVVGRDDAEPRVRAIAETLGAGLVGGSSPGAARYGVRVVTGETSNSWSSSIGSAGTSR